MLRELMRTGAGALVAMVVGMAIPLGAQAQTGQVVGRVTNADNAALIGAAQVSIEGTQIGALSGADGTFTIQGVPTGTHVVVVQRLGFAPLRQAGVVVTAGQVTTLNLTLRPTVLALQGIVATGLVDPVEGVRSPITVGRVDRTALPVPVAGSAVNNLQGRVPGVFMVRRDGTPGADVEMQLRTQTSIDRYQPPMIVVDGVILGSGSTNIESLDIESIEVIKGASAASLYGSRAASGVISITTNRGSGLQMGQTQFQARSEIGFSEAISNRRWPTHHHYLVDDPKNPTTYVDFNGNPVDRANRVQNPTPTSFQDKPYFVPIYDNLASGKVFRPGAFQTHTFMVSQNTADTNFAVTLNRFDQRGALENNDGYQRNSFRMNLDHRFLNTIALGVSAYHSRDHRDDAAGLSFNDLYRFTPEVDLTLKDENGEYLRIPDPNIDVINPLWVMANREGERNRVRTLGNANLRWEPRAWLSFSGSASYDREDSKTRTWVPKGVAIGFEDEQSTGSIAFATQLTDTWNAEVQTHLQRDFGPLNARVTFRGLMERSKLEQVGASATDFLVAGIPQINAAPASTRSSSSSEQEVRSLGYLGDLSLSYADKYIGSFLVRRDGSSLFGPDNRWHNYYRTAFAWRMGEEAWFNVPNVSEFKLSYARGTAGGRPGFSDQYEVWSVGASGVAKAELGNRNLRPEHTLEQEVSAEVIAFDGRLGVDVAHAWQRTSEQLFFETLPAFTGYGRQWTNGGVVYGQTTELTVEAQLIRRASFFWQSLLVADYSKGLIEEWPFACTNPSNTMRCTGVDTNSMWGTMEANNLRQLDTPQVWKVNPTDCHHGCAVAEAGRVDEFMLNDDGLLVWVGPGNHYMDGPGEDGVLGTADDLWGTTTDIGGKLYTWGLPFLVALEGGGTLRDQIGNTRHVGVGLANNFGFGALSLHVQLQGKIGGYVFNDFDAGAVGSYRAPMQDQGSKPEQLKKPQAYYVVIENTGANSLFLREMSAFLKLRTLSLTYRMPTAQIAQLGLENIGVRGVQLGLIGRDIYTITQYSGWDAETALRPDGTPPNDSGNGYPATRSYTMEVSLTF